MGSYGQNRNCPSFGGIKSIGDMQGLPLITSRISFEYPVRIGNGVRGLARFASGPLDLTQEKEFMKTVRRSKVVAVTTKVGRPRLINDLKVKKLRREGLSLKAIAGRLKVTVSGIQASIRRTK